MNECVMKSYYKITEGGFEKLEGDLERKKKRECGSEIGRVRLGKRERDRDGEKQKMNVGEEDVTWKI